MPVTKRSTARALQGVCLAAGAPLGWLVIQLALGSSAAAEGRTQPGLYLYMLTGAIIVFAVFGFVLGRHEDELVRANRTLEELAITDSLTGLRNARYFHARLEEEQEARSRSGEPLSLVIIDLDHFKRVNDEFGHVVGDAMLANTGCAIASVTRDGESAARVGGEEFALLLPGSDAEAAWEAAERVRRAVAAVAVPLPGTQHDVVQITASAGVASTGQLQDPSPSTLYRAADDALYRAKAGGRNRTVRAMCEDVRNCPQAGPSMFPNTSGIP
ncbi:MAG: GGDEF domain-containing protein [Gemmatimonadota bacterium]